MPTNTVYHEGDIRRMLKRHYLPPNRFPAGYFADEIASPCGRRRADLIWCPTAAGLKDGLIGHEIKVSRADVLAELSDPSKMDPWAQYCERWYLVVPNVELIAGLHIPPLWGVLAPPAQTRFTKMTIVRPAPKLNPVDTAPALRRLIKYQMVRALDNDVKQARKISRLESDIASHKRRADAKAEINTTGNRLDDETKRIIKCVEQAKSKLNYELQFWGGTVPDDVLIAALIDYSAAHAAAKRVRDHIESLITVTSNLTLPLESAKQQFHKAVKAALNESGISDDT